MVIQIYAIFRMTAKLAVSGSTQPTLPPSNIDSNSLWQCPICLDTLNRPILTTCCGQTFCQDCLDSTLVLADACPMCREPLLSGGKHSMIRNRALEELLLRMKSTEQAVVIVVHDEESLQSKKSKDHDIVDKMTTTRRFQNRVCHFCRNIVQISMAFQQRRRFLINSLYFQQWYHWCRIHWPTLQCVFYMFLFGFFICFLRVQEEEFTEQENKRIKKSFND